MRQDAELFARFESLGDNCEFGFVQRESGLEPGGLFRWSIASPTALTKCLNDRAAKLYMMDRLLPTSDDMVLDESYGVYFHTKMRSAEGSVGRSFVQGKSDREQTYREEYEKISYLRGKLIQQLEERSKVFVYKRNAGVDRESAICLLEAILSYNPGNTLLIVEQDPKQAPSLVRVNANLLVGYISQLAPYEAADSAAYDQWELICREAVAMIESR